MNKKIIGLCVIFAFIPMSFERAHGDVFEDFEGRDLGPYVTQTTAWRYLYDTPGRCESPMVVVDANSWSGTQCLNNSDDPKDSQYEHYSAMELYPFGNSNLPISGEDVTIEFWFLRTVEIGVNGYANRIQLNVYDTDVSYGQGGKNFAVSVYSERIYNENTFMNIVPNIETNTWYGLELTLRWDPNNDNYLDEADLVVWDDLGSHHDNGVVKLPIGSGNLSNFFLAEVFLYSGGEGDPLFRPNCYIDDLLVTGMVEPKECGDMNHPYPAADINQDCYVDYQDFSLMAGSWLDCTDANEPCNYQLP